jgi:uncharacterized protein HemX
MRAFYVILVVLLLAAAGGGAVSGQNAPQSHAEHHPEATAPQAPAQNSTQPGDMMARCQQMMSQRSEVMQRMEASDKKLDDLVTQMNQAKGGRRVDALVKVVNELAAQRKEMRQAMIEQGTPSAGMCQMMQGMMHGMMQGPERTPKK